MFIGYAYGGPESRPYINCAGVVLCQISNYSVKNVSPPARLGCADLRTSKGVDSSTRYRVMSVFQSNNWS